MAWKYDNNDSCGAGVPTHVEDGGDGVSVRVVDEVDEDEDGEGDPFPGGRVPS